MTAKIARVEGTCFKSAPMFKDLDKLPDDDQIRCGGLTNRMTQEDLEEEVEDLEEDDDEKEQKKKEKKAPSVSEMRKAMKKMIFFYEKSVAESIPTVYPLIGPVGDHQEDKSKGGGKKRKTPSSSVVSTDPRNGSKKRARK